MNEHILKVMVWMEDSNFYSDAVMVENRSVAYVADDDALAADDAAADDAAAAYVAAYYAANTDAADADRWINKYFKRSGDNRGDYDSEVQKRLLK